MTETKSVSIREGNLYLLEQAVAKVPKGTGFSELVLMGLEALVDAPDTPIPYMLDPIEVWKENIKKMPPKDLISIRNRAIQLTNLTEWELKRLS